MIKAEAHSDDRIYAVPFDAEPWFKGAIDASIIQLEACGFGGDYGADVVAQDSRGRVKRLDDMFNYIRLHNKGSTNHIGFECHVNPEQAKAWLKANKPELYVRLFLLDVPCESRLNEQDDEPDCALRDMCTMRRCTYAGCTQIDKLVKELKAGQEKGNENCLEGIRCPQCGSLGPFRLHGVRVDSLVLHDDGPDEHEGCDPAPYTVAQCCECKHTALWVTFSTKPPDSSDVNACITLSNFALKGTADVKQLLEETGG